MSNFRKIGIIGGAMGILLSSSVAFAQGPAVKAVTAQNQNRNVVGAPVATGTPQRIMETARERVQAIREDVKNRVDTLRAQVKQRIGEIKDKAKQQRAENLSTRFENLNKTWTDHFANLLDRYEAILQKIQDRANIAAGTGKDITTVNMAIQSAKTAIADAKTSVATQASKTYTPDVSTTTASSEEELVSGLRTMFQELHGLLFKDLFALRDGAMKNARTAVHNALQALVNVPGIDGIATTTSSSN